MAKKDLKYGGRTLYRILQELDEPEGLAHQYAVAVLAQAKRNAAKRPTPQAPMAARIMKVDVDTILPASVGDAADVAIGSEFGSSVYRQFHKPPTPRGYWLYPAGDAISVLAQADEALEEVLKAAVDG